GCVSPLLFALIKQAVARGVPQTSPSRPLLLVPAAFRQTDLGYTASLLDGATIVPCAGLTVLVACGFHHIGLGRAEVVCLRNRTGSSIHVPDRCRNLRLVCDFSPA